MRRLVSNGQLMSGVVKKTDNIVMQKLQKGTKKEKCYIIGNGHSISVDEKNRVIKHDPLMHVFETDISKEHSVYAFFFTFECAGLEKSSIEIAEFVNELIDTYDEIIFVGHSKCGVCLTNASCYCRKTVTLVTISTPYYGTVVTDKEWAEMLLKKRVFIKIYNMIFSDHKVDRDIAPDSDFLLNMNQPVCNRHINIISYFRSIRDCRNLIDLALFATDKIMHLRGDGVVPLTSQYPSSNTQEIYVFCSHASYLKEALKILESKSI